MRKADLKKSLASAEKAIEKLNTYCSKMANILQPYYEHEIVVTYIEGDGFVVVFEDEDCIGYKSDAPKTIPVDMILEKGVKKSFSI